MLRASTVVRLIGKVVVGISLFILNWYYLWTATFTGERLPYTLEVASQNFVYFQYNLLLGAGVVIDRYVFADTEALSMFFISSTVFFALCTGRGLRRAVIKTVCFSSLVLMPLGIEVYLLDRGEFWIHVTNLQINLNIVPWFSNEDLLFVATGSFLLSLSLLAGLPKSVTLKRSRFREAISIFSGN